MSDTTIATSPTITDLPDLSAPYTVTPEQTASYQENGHICLRNICTPEEIAAYAPVIIGAATRYAAKQRPLEERDTAGKAFVLVGGIWNRDPLMAHFTLARRFAGIAATLMGVPSVRVYHDVAINKEAGGGYTPWHQDAFYWPMDTPHTITMWMPLVDIDYRMGTLDFASGSHKKGDLGDGQLTDDVHAYFDGVIAEQGFPVVNYAKDGVLRAGDATFHSGWTLHSAPGNNSDRARQVITVVYYADGVNAFADMGNPHREADFRAYMPGVRPGERAASVINPVVFP